MSFRSILDKYRSESTSERDKGTKFEELISRYLMTDEVYAHKLEWVKLWNDFPQRMQFGISDTGIDLVAKTRMGEYWAIQCKCYAEDQKVSKEDMDTFLSTSGRKFRDDEDVVKQFELRLIIATTDNWSSNAIGVTEDQTIPVRIVGLSLLEQSDVDWDEIEKGAHGSDARKEKYSLRPHQKEAFDKAMEHYRDNDRGKMIMACGTGKTFTSLRIAEGLIGQHKNEKQPLVLFLAPSISLVGQTLREWMHNTVQSINAICVCSDRTVNKKRVEDDVGERIETLGLPSTTDASVIRAQYMFASEPTVIFSTYQSIDAVIEAQKAGLPEFDLIVCDEAHRTTGVIVDKDLETAFTKVHDNNNINSKKRLYMTATPRLYGEKGKADAKKESIVLCSMDDESIYGKEFYSISFGKAVELDLLSDYKVLILTTTASDIPDVIKRHWTNGGREIDADTDCKLWGCMSALAKNIAYDETVATTDPGKMHSAVAFCRNIAVSKAVTDRFNELAKSPLRPLDVNMKHIDGSMNSMTRDRLLNWLKEDSDVCHVLSNVRCLSEGVDVPALDAVMFLDSKGSLVDVVQSVGRVMRKADSKLYGYIIIPIVVPENEDPESALDDNERYKVVWQVLRALRSHDERLEAEINTFNYRSDHKSKHIIIGGIDNGGERFEPPLIGGNYTLDDFGNALLARLVLKVGNREYIENWAKSVAEIMPDLIGRLTKICQAEEYGTRQFKPAFKRYVKGLKECVNDNVPDSQAIDMLAQQIITKPIFEKLFTHDGGFALKNSVSAYIDKMLEEIDAKNGLKDIQEKLDRFYETVEITLNGIDTTEGKQKVITALYEKFFKNAFPKDQMINGVVYTPQEIVDFIIHSCTGVLKQEFGKDISDEGVNILDPFTGTGTFIARLMESGLITKDNIYRKYNEELFANEITLLAYYIALVNIENTFARITNSTVYTPFNHMLLTDTFNIDSLCTQMGQQTTLDPEDYFIKNKKRIREEHNTQFTIIMGNPPYGGRQKSASNDAKKRKYLTGVDSRITETYLNPNNFDNNVTTITSVFDNYVRAYRWATDCIGDNDGIIAFVTPNGWMTSSAFEGFRKTLENEFAKIFVFNLRGDKGSTDEARRVEGRNVFEYSSDRGGCTIGIAITLLVKRKQHSQKASIYYYDISTRGDRLKGFEKRAIVKESVSFQSLIEKGKMVKIKPKTNGDWLVERNEKYLSLVPLAGDTHKKFEKHDEKTIFCGYSGGYNTSRDIWSYNYSKDVLQKNIQTLINEYVKQTAEGIIDYTKVSAIKWSRSLENYSKKKTSIEYDSNKVERSKYRPFVSKWFYRDEKLIEMSYQMAKLYPKEKNLCIGVNFGDKKDFSCLITNSIADLHYNGTTQFFPLYWYTMAEITQDPKQRTLFGFETHEPKRNDGISDFALIETQKRYGELVTKEDIFYYVYGYLHSPDYRKAFSDDLKLSLPRIEFVDSYDDFLEFSNAGRKLADLHLNYESVEPYQDLLINGKALVEEVLSNKNLLRVNKMRLFPEERKLVYNQHIEITNIPEKAFEYIVNGRSALGWLVDQYQVSTDKESGIVNDPNEYAGPDYIFNLVLSIITVSVKTMEIIESLPKLKYADQNESSNE